jgi:hypothetical protein
MTTSALTVTLPELYNPQTGRLDARRIAQYLDVPLARLAQAIGSRYQTLHKTSDAPAIQARLFVIKRALDILAQMLGERRMVLAWLNTPHPDLGMTPPLAVMLDGRAGVVEAMLAAAAIGLPT